MPWSIVQGVSSNVEIVRARPSTKCAVDSLLGRYSSGSVSLIEKRFSVRNSIKDPKLLFDQVSGDSGQRYNKI